MNAGLQAVGLPRQGFLQDPSEALVVLAIVYFWTQFGFNIVIYLAALQDIPQEVLEAASIDGAGKWSTFWHVTVPTVRPVTIFLLVWGLIDGSSSSTSVYTTTKGGPLNSDADARVTTSGSWRSTSSRLTTARPSPTSSSSPA